MRFPVWTVQSGKWREKIDGTWQPNNPAIECSPDGCEAEGAHVDPRSATNVLKLNREAAVVCRAFVKANSCGCTLHSLLAQALFQKVLVLCAMHASVFSMCADMG